MDLAAAQVPASTAHNGAPDLDPRPRHGFYRSESAVFYVTEDARVYLVRSADEPACLHRCRMLPATAVPSTARVEPELELLARTADGLGRPASARIQSIRAEVRRDRLIAVGALLQETLACVSEELGHLLLDERHPDPDGLHERMVERLAAIDLQRHALDNQGINHRGERANIPAPAPDVPMAAAPFVHRGDYIGWFMGLDAAGEKIAGPFAGRTAEAAASIRNAHLRGELWTIARDGLVYVFRCPSNSAAVLCIDERHV